MAFLFLTTVCLNAQTEGDVDSNPQIVLRPTIPAYFVGCSSQPEGTPEKLQCSSEKMMNFIANNLQYPDVAREEKIEGVVVLAFVVSDKGEVQNVKVLRDIGGGCGDEAKRVLESMPHWQPAIYKGKNVYTQFSLPFTFSLKTGLFDFVLHLGDLVEGEVYKDELYDVLLNYEPRVTNPKGEEMKITEIIYTFERGGKRKEVVSYGSDKLTKKQISDLIRKRKGRLTVEANVVDGLDLRTVIKNFVIVK